MMAGICPRCGRPDGLHFGSCPWRHLTIGPAGETWPRPPRQRVGVIAGAFTAWAVLTAAGGLVAWLAAGRINGPALLVIACAAIVVLPPRFDPAIQIKERRLRNASPYALPGETEADTIARLLKQARDK